MSNPSSTASKPTIVLVPGAFHTPAHFLPLTKILHESSYPTVCVSLPSIGAQAGSSAGYAEDVGAIRSTVEKLIEDEGRDVMLVMHSYGGVPGCQTVCGLGKTAREKGGEEGGVVHMLFMNTVLAEPGQTIFDVFGGQMPPWAKVDGNLNHPVDACSNFYNDLSSHEAEYYTSILLPQTPITGDVDIRGTCNELAVPKTYLLCSEDKVVQASEAMLAKMKEDRWRVERIPGGHCPFIGSKIELVEVIERCLNIADT